MSGFLCSMVGASFTVAAVAEVLRAKRGITALGNAQVDTAQSKFGGSSLLLDGTGDALSTAGIAFGTGDFTVEYWIRPTAQSGYDIHWDLRGTPTSNLSPIVYTLNGTLYVDVGATTVITGSALSNNTWYHIALSRSGSSTKLFVDGTQVGSTYTDTNNYVSAATLYIGELYSLAGNGVVGNMDEFRISNSARYTTTFTPSTTAFVNDANTLLLIHANGTDAVTFFEDDNGVRTQRGITAVGNAQIDTAQSKFGGASALFDGTGDHLLIPGSSDWRWNTTNYTIEFWTRVNTHVNTGSNNLPAQIGSMNPNSGTAFWNFGTDDVGKITFHYYNGAVTKVAGSTNLSTGVQYHLAMVYTSSDNTIKLYVDGTQAASAVVSGTPQFSDSLALCLGQYNSVGYNGHIDEVRISNTARYTANFTPATEPFVNDSNTLLLIHGDGTDASTVFRDDNGQGRTQKGISAVGNAQIDTAQSKFGGASALFDGNGDYLTSPNSSDYNFTGNYTIEGWWYQASNVAAGIYPTLIATGAVGDNKGWQVSSEPTTNRINYITSPNGSSGMSVLLTSANLSAATWNHWAIVRNNSVLTLYINGTASGSTYTTTGNSIASTYPLYIGGGIGGLSSGNFSSSSATVVNLNGHLDELRISNTARYTANFTAPTAPFQNDANTVLLLHMDGTDASTVFTDDNGIAPYTP